MNFNSTIKKIPALLLLASVFFITKSTAQTCEWRLTNATFNPADPDGAGPATGSATFTLQVRTTGATITNINSITTGYSYQSTKAMVPTTPGCAIVSNPANITVSPFFVAGGFAYTTVNQCLDFNQPTANPVYDKRVNGSMDGTSVTLTPTWQDMMTITLWTLGTSYPQGGTVIINSSEGATPGEYTGYAIADAGANGYPASSLTYIGSDLAIGGTLPVLFSSFEAKCSNNGTLISWSTAQEANSDFFEVQRSADGGNTWTTIGNTPAAGNSTASRNYNQIDLEAGNAIYRIKQVDKNGQAVYTDYARSNCQVKNISTVIYPVPAKDMLNVVIKSDRAVRTQLMVFEISGKLVRKLDANVQNGTNNFRINLTGLPSGDYILKSSDAGIELNKQFSVIK